MRLTMRALVITLLAGCGGVAVASLYNSLGPPPSLFVSSTAIDFGRLEAGQLASREVTLRNEGAQELEIQRVSRSCGCTQVSVGKRNLHPGESTQLTVAMTGKEHSQGGQVVIHFGNETVEIDAVATGAKRLDVVPHWLDFGDLSRSQLPVTKTLQVTPNDMAIRNTISGVRGTLNESSPFTIETQSVDGHVEVSVTIPSTVPSGEIVEYATINHPSGVETRAKLYARILDGFQANPSSLQLGPHQKSASVKILRPTAGDLKGLYVKELVVSESIRHAIVVQENNGENEIGFNVEYPIAKAIGESDGYILANVYDATGQVGVVNIPITMRAR